MNWFVAILAVITALDVPQRARLLRDVRSRQRGVAAAGLVAVAIGLAIVATILFVPR